MCNSLKYFFNPEGIAVVGASNNPDKAGHVIVKNLMEMEYAKGIYPVNRTQKEILGLKVYKDLSEIEEKVNMVVIATPSKYIFEIMKDLELRMQSNNDIKVIICAAAGFAEVKSKAGIQRQEVLLDTAKRYNIRVMGPNCIGVIDNKNKVDTSFVETLMPKSEKGKPGGISFISQSGALASSILMMGASLPAPMRFNKFISIGNMADVGFIELLEYLETDPDTRVIGLYMEGYQDARSLLKVMNRITFKKPIVVLKVGRTERGAVAASSHTGSLAGQDKIYDAAFRQYGVIRVSSIYEIMDTLRAFDMLPLPRGNRLFLYSQAGGPGIHCMDILNEYKYIDFPVIRLSAKNRLKKTLLPMASICNPEGYVDITASATVSHHVDGLDIVLNEDNVDTAILLTVVPTFLPRKKLAKALKDYILSEKCTKPIFLCIMAGKYVGDLRARLENAGILTFDTPGRAARACANMISYFLFLKKRGEPSSD